MKNNRKNEKGFSLIELAIVMVIIGLIVAGILGGQSVMRSANLRGVISDVNNFRSVVTSFQDIYNGLPGDINTATQYWPGAGITADGDANNLILLGTEDFRAWQHLSLAEMIPTNYTGVVGGGVNIGTNVPVSSVKGGGFRMFNTPAIHGKTGNTIQFGAEDGTDLTNAILSPVDAKAIDEKADDSHPETGGVRGVDAGNTSAVGACEATAAYTLSNVTPECLLYFFPIVTL